MKVKYGEGKVERKDEIDNNRNSPKKRARDANYSEAINAERVKNERKKRLELRHSSLQNQFWSWRLKYEEFLFCF